MHPADSARMTYGATIRDALDDLHARGYRGQLRVADDSLVECLFCEVRSEPETVTLDQVCRIEGTSDPGDEVAVAAVTCPACGAKGTLIVNYGVGAPAEEARVLRRMQPVATR